MSLKDEVVGLSIAVIPTLILAVLLSGCSSAPRVADRPQYCYTSQTIQLEDGSKVSSKTTVECTDDQIKKLVLPRAGIASNCGQYTYYVTLKNKPVKQTGLACEKYDGNWEIIPNNTTR